MQNASQIFLLVVRPEQIFKNVVNDNIYAKEFCLSSLIHCQKTIKIPAPIQVPRGKACGSLEFAEQGREIYDPDVVLHLRKLNHDNIVLLEVAVKKFQVLA